MIIHRLPETSAPSHFTFSGDENLSFFGHPQQANKQDELALLIEIQGTEKWKSPLKCSNKLELRIFNSFSSR